MLLLQIIFGTAAGILFQILIHESGHMIFGLFTGYRFSSFRIGNLMLVKKNGRLHLKRLSITGTGGQCLMSPPDLIDGKIPVWWYNIGGVLMNLITGILFLILFAVLPHFFLLSIFFLLSGVIGLIFAAINGIPFRGGVIDNDGRNAISLKNNKAAMKGFWLQLKVNEETSRDIRLKDMPKEWFSLPSDEEMQDSMTAACAVMAANRMVDAHEFEEADRYMEHIMSIDSKMAEIHWLLCACDRIYIHLLWGDPKIMKGLYTEFLVKFMKQMKNFPSVIRTEYTIALLYEKDPEKVRILKERFEKISRSYPYRSDLESEQELMKLAEEQDRRKDSWTEK